MSTCISTAWVLSSNAASWAPLLIDQIRVSGGVAQASPPLRSKLQLLLKHTDLGGYRFCVWSVYEPRRACTLKAHVPVCKVCFSLENCLFCIKCPFSTISPLHFAAQTFKDIIKGVSSLKACCTGIAHNYVARLGVGPFSNIKWNVALNSITLKYKTLLWKNKVRACIWESNKL